MKRWKVEVHSKLDAVLLLSSVNLPGGELRRRSEEDERMMRDYLKEGDLISAEVQNIMSDGTLMLHTRSLKYGKLGQGTMIQVGIVFTFLFISNYDIVFYYYYLSY